MVDRWLRELLNSDVTWTTDDAAGKPDLMVRDVGIDVKTVKRQVPPHESYTSQMQARHIEHPGNEPADHYFFATFEVPKRTLLLLGGIRSDEFKAKSRRYGPGERAHANYVVRGEHAIYSIRNAHLIEPDEWCSGFTDA